VSSRITTLLALDDGVDRETVSSTLPAGEDLQILGYVEGVQASQHAVEQTRADLFLVVCPPNSAGALEVIKSAAGHNPEGVVVVMQQGAAETNGFMHDVFAAGADDIIPLPDTPERVRHALLKAIARKRGTLLGKGKPPAPLVCVLGPKGGTGKTVTSTNLAVLLAEQGHATAIVDLDLHFGDVGLGLRLTPDRTIYDLARSAGKLDEDKLEGFLLEHTSGLKVLLAPTRPDHAGAVSTTFVAEVLALLRASMDMVVVDTPAGFPPEVITAIDSSTDACMVGMLDAFSLKDTKLGLETLELMGYSGSSIRLVLNRADSHVGIAKQDVKAILGREPDVLVPSDRDVPLSVTEGIPLVTSRPRSDAAKALRELAALYDREQAVAVPDASGRRRSLLRRT
jgi:pilus assembly protein CpaE